MQTYSRDASISPSAVVHKKPWTLVKITACDSREIYDVAKDIGANVVVPPIKNFRVNKNGSKNRNETVRRVKKVGRRIWKKEAGYHRQGTVENTFFRYKTIIGGRLRSRCKETQETEAMLACNILNRMFELGRPKSMRIKS